MDNSDEGGIQKEADGSLLTLRFILNSMRVQRASNELCS